MTTPTCDTSDCFGAYFASRSAGLYETNNLIFDDDSDPTWTRVGQTLDIYQFTFDYKNPVNTQACLDFGQNVWVRRPTAWGDDWVMKATKADIISAMGLAPSTNIDISWIEYDPNGNLYLAVYVRNVGAYCVRNTNYGDGAWNTFAVYPDGYCKGTGSVRKNHHTSLAGTPYPDIMWMGLNLGGWSGRGGMMFSADQGVTWGPRDAGGNPNPVFDGTLGGSAPDVAPSTVWDTGCYFARKEGLAGYANTLGFTNNLVYDKDGGNYNNCPPNDPGYFWYQNSMAGQTFYAGSYLGYVWITEDIESAPYSPAHVPTWRSVLNPADIGVGACDGTGNDYCIFGSDSSRIYIAAGALGRKEKMCVLFSTQDHFVTNRVKCGISPWSASLTSGSIRYDCGGVAKNGVKVWEQADPPDPETPPVAASGWPVWINCEARELRKDPSFDRLYVGAETVWPAGEGLWNQPLMFQFLLSGDLSNTYFENQGFLAFLPTLAMGQPTIYSGGISYDGSLEMHTLAPQAHGVLCAGMFDTGQNVFWNQDISNSNFALLSGWPASGWVVVGDFGNERATSIQNDFAIDDDLAITHSDLTMVTESDEPPWTWDELEEAPFSVNYQYREGQSLWVGAEGVGQEPPIQYTYISISGALVWEERGGGLPAVQINDITRGQ